jgi:hypothetical protein
VFHTSVMVWSQMTIGGSDEPMTNPAPESSLAAYTRKRQASRQEAFGLGHEIAKGNMPMFMTGGEIKEHYAPNEGDRNPKPNNIFESESDNEVWARKLKESKMTGVERYGKERFERDRGGAWRSLAGPQLAAQGIRPESSIESVSKAKGAPQGTVAVETTTKGTNRKPQVLGGHHRIALAAEQFKSHFFPVKHSDSMEEAQRDRSYQ